MTNIKLTIDELEEILHKAKFEKEFNSGNGTVIISNNNLEFPCIHKECHSTFVIRS